MDNNIQVDKTHYDFKSYMPLQRWCSVWYQLCEINKLKPSNTLEIGPGSGLLKEVGRVYDFHIKTLDIDPELMPDYVGSVTAIPIGDYAFDLVCAFQVLEHLVYEDALMAFAEMVRVSKKNILISLPDAKTGIGIKLYVNKIGAYKTSLNNPLYVPQEHAFDGEHYWEIGKRGYNLNKIKNDFTKTANLIKTYRVPEMPYHRFFVFDKYQD